MAPAPPPVPRTIPNQSHNELNSSNNQIPSTITKASQSQAQSDTSPTSQQVAIAGPTLTLDDQAKQSNIFPKLSSSN